VSTKLSILSLNTIYFYQPNHAAPDCNIAGPAANQISWINAVLTAAAAAGRKVYLTGHIPPDPGFYKPGCMAAYSALSSKFAATIGGHLYAHTHQDNFIFATDPKFVLDTRSSDHWQP
jgi:endopolyphosphatase